LGTIIFRTILLFIVVVISMRLMGKRQIGELQPFELVVAILISELAAMPMQDTDLPLHHGIISIAILTVLQLLTSFFALKSYRARKLICGSPSILIENGKLIEKNLRKELFTLNDLLEQLRIKDINDIHDVEFAILETNGTLSVIPKSQKRPVTPSDLKIETNYEGISLNLIIDGRIDEENLTLAKVDHNWLMEQLLSQGYTSAKQVLYASINTSGEVYIQGKEKAERLRKSMEG